MLPETLVRMPFVEFEMQFSGIVIGAVSDTAGQ